MTYPLHLRIGSFLKGLKQSETPRKEIWSVHHTIPEDCIQVKVDHDGGVIVSHVVYNLNTGSPFSYDHITDGDIDPTTIDEMVEDIKLFLKRLKK